MRAGEAAEQFAEQRFVELGDATVCYRKPGEGPALVLFHGYPVSGYTWRKVVPELSNYFTCYAFDLIGLGNSRSRRTEDFTSPGQGRTFQRAVAALGISSYAL